METNKLIENSKQFSSHLKTVLPVIPAPLNWDILIQSLVLETFSVNRKTDTEGSKENHMRLDE